VKFSKQLEFDTFQRSDAISDYMGTGCVTEIRPSESAGSGSDWKPTSWPATYRFLFVRHQVQRQGKEPLQLDLFEPRDFDYDYRVVITNKIASARSMLLFH
jgi:hypothetical protein